MTEGRDPHHSVLPRGRDYCNSRAHSSLPGRGLAWGVGACTAAGLLLPFTPLAPWLGFTALPPAFFGFLLVMITTYLGLVEVVKGWFYRRYAPEGWQ